MKSCFRYIGYLLTNPDVEFWRCEGDVALWRLEYRGAGRYFTSIEALCGYCAGRFWIRCDQVNALASQLEANANSILIFEPKPRYKCNYWR